MSPDDAGRDDLGPRGPSDDELLAAIGGLWHQVDPPPADLVDGVLARIAAEDLEFDLLTLVESEETLAGVRSAGDPTTDPTADPADGPAGGEEGSWSLEYTHSDFRLYLRLARIEDRTRLDGWVVPSRPLTVRLLAEATDAPQETTVDEFGRFELPAAPSGLARLLFLDEPPTADRPRITPPFWI
jgi:hypothetical protein